VLTSTEAVEAAVDRESAANSARDNLNLFAALAVPEIFLYLYPAVFLAIWQILLQAAKRIKGKDYLAIGLPRGFGKTIFLKLYVVYLILFTDRQFILIVCNTDGLAQNFLADVADILDSSNIKAIFGNWRIAITKDTLNQKKFSFRGRNIVLAAMSSGASLRGLNIKFVRPDVIIMDDMQSREQAESVVEAIKITSWMLGTLMKAASPHRCLYVFVGNMYPFEGSILKKLKYNPTWISFITGAIQEDGESIWPELKSIDDLLTELENDTTFGHPEIFYSEVMNDEEAGTRSGVDISQIKSYRTEELPAYHIAGCVIIDPSGKSKKSDDTVLGAMLMYDEKPVLRELKIGKLTPQETIREAISLALKWKLPAIVVEGVAYQSSLKYWLDFFIAKLGITGLEVLLIFPGAKSKTARILDMFKELVKGEIQLHIDTRSQVVNQIVHFNPLKIHNKDDILDILSYFRSIIIQYKYQIMRPFLIENEQSSGSTHTEELDLQF